MSIYQEFWLRYNRRELHYINRGTGIQELASGRAQTGGQILSLVYFLNSNDHSLVGRFMAFVDGCEVLKSCLKGLTH